MSSVNKKILWISDFNLDTAPGGAQRSDELIIEKGKLQGFSIKKITRSDVLDVENFDDFNTLISSNVTVIINENPEIINKIASHDNHIRLEHDSNEHITDDERKLLFSNCKKTIFLTDYHYSFFKELYGDIFQNVKIVYDPIDSSVFKDRRQEREDKTLFAGYLHEAKGADTFFEYVLDNPDKEFVIAGFSSSKIYHILADKLPNVKFLGTVDYEKMPEIYIKYESMFYTPIVREPFCRSAAEAAMCGMKILTNKQERIGSLQEIKKHGIEKFSEKCKNAASKFWEVINE